MNPRRRWEPSVSHRGEAAKAFFKDYFGREDRQLLLIGGAGFDPRSTVIAETLASVAQKRMRGLFICEKRPRSDAVLRTRAESHIQRLKELVDYSEATIEIFSSDGAIIGGQQAGSSVRANTDFSGVTDIILDFSAISKGVSFPVAKGFLDGTISAGTGQGIPNLHAVVVEESWTDSRIIGEASDRVEAIRGFQGLLGQDEMENAARLWLPQLTKEEGTREVLRRIYNRLNPHGVCPILPFPAFDPRLADELLAYHEEAIGNEWQVDGTDLIYADEKSPLDLYRTILRIDDARRHVFGKEVGESLLILSPLGSKALAIGCFMAAYERNFPIVYVEATGSKCDQTAIDSCRGQRTGEIIHIWLAGDVYPPT
jgi:hypothetical protein